MFCMFFFPSVKKVKLWVGIEMSIVLWVSKKLPYRQCFFRWHSQLRKNVQGPKTVHIRKASGAPGGPISGDYRCWSFEWYPTAFLNWARGSRSSAVSFFLKKKRTENRSMDNGFVDYHRLINWYIITDWWFGTFFIFHYIWDVILPIDFHILISRWLKPPTLMINEIKRYPRHLFLVDHENPHDEWQWNLALPQVQIKSYGLMVQWIRLMFQLHILMMKSWSKEV